MENENEELTMRGAAIPLIALMVPFLLWPIEQWLPYPAVIEELTKLGLVLLIIKNAPTKIQPAMVLSVGILFAASETLLYIVNAVHYGNLGVLGWRMMLTVPMHLATFMILYTAVKMKLWWAGLAIAILIHWSFNYLAGLS